MIKQKKVENTFFILLAISSLIALGAGLKVMYFKAFSTSNGWIITIIFGIILPTALTLFGKKMLYVKYSSVDNYFTRLSSNLRLAGVMFFSFIIVIGRFIY